MSEYIDKVRDIFLGIVEDDAVIINNSITGMPSPFEEPVTEKDREIANKMLTFLDQLEEPQQ